jgi:hypothetical protein
VKDIVGLAALSIGLAVVFVVDVVSLKLEAETDVCWCKILDGWVCLLVYVKKVTTHHIYKTNHGAI